MQNLKNKIAALLAKTEANGCTKEEALTALSKAQELMRKHAIEAGEVLNPNAGEEIIEKVFDPYKTGYNVDFFAGTLARLFDCHLWRRKEWKRNPNENSRRRWLSVPELHVVGYESDVDLVEYFYNYILNAAFSDLKEYKKTAAYSSIVNYQGENGRTVAANFLKNYLLEVCNKIDALYQDRQAERRGENGLILYDKAKDVQRFFNSLNLNLTGGNRTVIKAGAGSAAGAAAGANLSLNQGVKRGNSKNVLKLG